jgi:4-carboxymuconolactone decarboxylase
MSRLRLLQADELDEHRRPLFDAMTAGPRGSSILDPTGALVGPFNAWLYSPAIGDAVQKLGAAIRFRSSLPKKLLELAILITAREWTAQFEWWAHARLAAKEGLEPEIIAAIKERRRPDFSAPEQATVYDFCRELLTERRISQSRYDQAVALLGETGLVDLVTLLGYYSLVSMTLNAFEVPAPDGEGSLTKYKSTCIPRSLVPCLTPGVERCR